MHDAEIRSPSGHHDAWHTARVILGTSVFQFVVLLLSALALLMQ